MPNCLVDEVVFFGFSVPSKRHFAAVAEQNSRDEAGGQTAPRGIWGQTMRDRNHLFESKGTCLYVATNLLDTCINLLDVINECRGDDRTGIKMVKLMAAATCCR